MVTMKQPVKKILSIMLVTLLAFFVAHAAAATMDENEDAPTVVAEAEQEVDEEEGMLDFISLRGVKSHKMTCAHDPSICLVRGSPGKDCCKKVCVDTKTDNRNCGGCKVKCKNSYDCCQGLCVPPTSLTCNSLRLALREEV